MKIRSVISVATCAALCTLALSAFGCSAEEPANETLSNIVSQNTSKMSSQIPEATAQFDESELLSGKHHATIEVEGYSPVEVELDADSAPISVTNFVNLANDGYYDGKTFYRVVEDFCLQGGTEGNSASGNDPDLETITGEFASNGVVNELADHFEKGTIAMARSSLPNSATSTFFITLGDNSQVGASLDGQYAAFGTIDEKGMTIIDQIVADSVAAVDDPTMGAISDESLQPKIVSIKVID